MALITIIGRKTGEGKMGTGNSGQQVLEVSFAENYKKATTFYTLSAWEGLADTLNAFSPNDRLEIQGTMKPGDIEAYLSKNGEPKFRAKVTVKSVAVRPYTPKAKGDESAAAAESESLDTEVLA